MTSTRTETTLSPDYSPRRRLSSLDTGAIVLFTAAISFGTVSGLIAVTAISALLMVGFLAIRGDQTNRESQPVVYTDSEEEETSPNPWIVPVACIIIAAISIAGYFFAPLDYLLVVSTAIALVSALIMWLALGPYRS